MIIDDVILDTIPNAEFLQLPVGKRRSGSAGASGVRAVLRQKNKALHPSPERE